MKRMKQELIGGNGRKILQTGRLELREMSGADFSSLCKMLQDIEVMYAWEHAFNDNEVQAWIERNMVRYRKDGCGYWLAFERESGICVGQLGLLKEEIFGVNHIGIGWILAKKYWGMGYAVEGAAACLDYAFNKLNASRVIADIRPHNMSSRRVAERIGMHEQGCYDKIYNGVVMPHLLYVARTPRIEVKEYDAVWSEWFAQLNELLHPVVKRYGGRVEHVGSTSVTGLIAKPVIDADYILPEPSVWQGVKTALEEIGFFHRGDGGLKGREMFTESLHLPFRHNLYVCFADSLHLKNHLMVRDFLSDNPEWVYRYGELKMRLAAQYPEDIDAYCAGKSALLAEILSASGFSDTDVAEIYKLNTGSCDRNKNGGERGI